MKKDKTPPDKPAFLTVAEFAAQLRIHISTAYRHIETGNIRGVRIGRSVRIPASELARFIEAAKPSGEGGEQ